VLHIPEIPKGCSVLEAAELYRAAGWYTVPIRQGKHAGSVLGEGWPAQTSLDPETVREQFSRPGVSGIALHVGKSGAVAFDVDSPENLPDWLGSLLSEADAPRQQTRENQPARAHFLFDAAGAQYGNGLGSLPRGWGDVRGANGVVVVAPTKHSKPDGMYRWARTGALPPLPSTLAEALPEAGERGTAATKAAVKQFLQAHNDRGSQPKLFRARVTEFEMAVSAGESRHVAMTNALTRAMEEAADGTYSAVSAAQAMRDAFSRAVATPGASGTARSESAARAEFLGILEWAVGQVTADKSERAEPAPKAPEAEKPAEPEEKPEPAPKKRKAPAGSEPRYLIYAWLTKHYAVGRSTDGRPIVIPKAGARVIREPHAKNGAFREEVTSGLLNDLGLIPTPGELTAALEALAGAAHGADPVKLAMRADYDGGRIVVDLGDQTGRVVVITEAGWNVEESTEQHPLFDRARTVSPLPTPERGGDYAPLLSVLGLQESDTRWHLIRGWLAVAFFADTPRPLLWFTGAAGSAKTTRAVYLTQLVDPRAALAVSPEKKPEDMYVTAASRYLFTGDNIGGVSDVVSNFLCTLVTGAEEERRELYTTAQTRTLEVMRTGILTSITLPAGLRPDALERIVPIRFDPPTKDKRALLEDLAREFDLSRGALFGAVLDDAVRVLRGTEAVRGRGGWERLSDYSMRLAALDHTLGTNVHLPAFVDGLEDALFDRAEESRFVVALRDFLSVQPDGTWEGITSELMEGIAETRPQDLDTGGRYEEAWPTVPTAFGRKLAESQPMFKIAGITHEEMPRSKRRRPFRLTLAGVTRDAEEPESDLSCHQMIKENPRSEGVGDKVTRMTTFAGGLYKAGDPAGDDLLSYTEIAQPCLHADTDRHGSSPLSTMGQCSHGESVWGWLEDS